MTTTVAADPKLAMLFTAIGLTDGDGEVVASWFDDPLVAAKTVLSNPVQRAGLLELVRTLLPDDGPEQGWHPLLDSEAGNVYVTIEGDVIGVAGAIWAQTSGGPTISGSVRLPLVDVSGELRAIAGSPEGPIRLGLSIEFNDPAVPVRSLAAFVTIDTSKGAGVLIELGGVDLGSGPIDIRVDTADLGSDMVAALRVLLAEAVESLSAGDERVARLSDHLLAMLGLGADAIPPLPLDRILDDPAVVRDWLVDIVDSSGTLREWGTHLAGLIGVDRPATGLATAASPLRAPLLDLGPVDLDLLLNPTDDGQFLEIGIALTVRADVAALDAAVTILAVPLQPGHVTRVVPRLTALVRAPGTGVLVDDAPTLRLGGLQAGMRLLDGQVQPWLALEDVTLDGVDHGTVDLTDADAIADVVTAQLDAVLEQALGTTGIATALLALLGLRPPRGDPSSPHRLDLAAFGRSPTRALGDFHRAVLADPAHSWEHLFAELGALLDLPAPVEGAGETADPWVVTLASSGPVRLDLAAWDAHDPAEPASYRRLRVGLVARGDVAPATIRWQGELLAMDLPEGSAGSVQLLGWQVIEAGAGPICTRAAPMGLQVGADSFLASMRWRPGSPLRGQLTLAGLTVASGPESYGPLDWDFPGVGADLGLTGDAIGMLRLLLAEAVHAWGGESAYVVAALLGLHRDLPWLPDDWPVLSVSGGIADLLADPAAALRALATRLLTGLSATGEPFVAQALSTLGMLLSAGRGVAAGIAPASIDLPGSGTYDDPWALALPTSAGSSAEVLLWLDPDGPPGDWGARLTARLAEATDGAGLAALLTAAGAQDESVRWLLEGRDVARLGPALDVLADWLESGDGLIPLAGQLPSGASWKHGTTVAAPHSLIPRDPGVIGQVAAALAEWATAGADTAVFVSAPIGDRTDWDDLLAVVGPGRPAGTHFDLRSLPDPADVELAAITVVAQQYTADLHPGTDQLVQLERVVLRAHELAGATKVVVVAHSSAGVTARLLASARPDLVAGLVTLGTPHAGSPLTPLLDPDVAAALRTVAAATSAIAGTGHGVVLGQLLAALDGADGPFGAPATLPEFGGVPEGFIDVVPGLAIGSALGGDAIGLLAGGLVASPTNGAVDPTHVALGFRTAIAVPPAVDGDIAVRARARMDLLRIRLDPTSPEPVQPAGACVLEVTASRPGGWLVGGDEVDTRPGLRWLEAGVAVRPGATGTPVAEPWLRLHEVTTGAGATRPIALGDAQVAAALDPLLSVLQDAPPDTAAGMLLRLLNAAGVVRSTVDGLRSSALGIDDLRRAPTQALAARRDLLLAELFPELRLGTDSISLAPAGFPLELSLDVDTWQARLHTTGDLGLPHPLGGQIDVRLDICRFDWTAACSLSVGAVALTLDAGGTVTLAAEPWLPAQSLRPLDVPALQAALTEAVPRIAVSAAVTCLAGSRLSSALGPVDLLLVDPVGWLRGGGPLTSGDHLDGDRIGGILSAIAEFLGLDPTGGLGLPGGYLVAAGGVDPARISVAGTFGSVTSATVGLDISIDIHADGHVTPAAAVKIGLALPGDWGALEIDFGVGESGVRLVVTPESADPIRLLPSVDGLAALANGATALLPHVLQRLVTWLEAQPGAHDLLAAALEVATALDVYADDSQGFEEAGRSARLRAMLEPGWLEHEIADSGEVARLVAALFGPTRIVLPAGMTVTRAGDRLRWSMAVFPGCTVGIEVGWSAAGPPHVTISVSGLDTGPVSILDATLGYADDLTASLRLRVEPGGELEFLTPEFELGLAGTAFSARILPIGAADAQDLEIVIVPVPQVTITPEGAFAVVGAWLVPLVARFLLPQFEDALEDELWTGGPSPREILDAAGLVRPSPAPLALQLPLPAVPDMALGALFAALDGATVRITPDLTVSGRYVAGRLGVRVAGRVDFPAQGQDGLGVSLRFGDATWLTDSDGVTVWILRDQPGADPPVEIDPALTISGLGAYFTGANGDPLIDGAVNIGSLGALVFFDASFMQAGQARLTVNDLGASIEAVDAKIVLSAEDGDSFVAQLLPPELQAPFDLALAYRHQLLEIHGGIGQKQDGIELTFPLDLDLLGIIFLRELFLAGYVEDSRLTAVAAISANAALGPIAVDVTRVGLQLVIDDHGPHVGFKPPDGFGLSLDASVVRAAGYLLVQGTRYVGAVEIDVFDKFQLSAIGIVTTTNVDGSPGFSLLLLISMQLPVPIPIGYGFFFAGAGGLLGLNRSMDVDRIRAGLRAGTADSILFPTDIVNRIDAIVRDLEESFPQQEGHFLIGPMVSIQWMNPALVTLKVGLVIEIAAQPNIAILGLLRLALPTPDEPVVDIKVAFLGSIDIGAGLLAFDASIYDSFIGYGDFKLSLDGDIAIRVSWGASPDLVASIGGFHPSYTPAANLKLPRMRRLTLALLKDNPSITLRLYLAVTSNTVQMGAQLQLYIGVAGFSITGDMGFDVLVQIVPFLLDAHLWASLAVRMGDTDICSISLDLKLTGPTPWIARGRASFRILFVSVTVEVEARSGEEQHTSLPSEPVLSRLMRELGDPKAWSAELGAVAATGIAMLPVAPGTLVVDAAGLLTVRQNLLPLATDIGLIGPVPPADIRRAEITEMRFGSTVVPHDDVLAPYAPSAFAGAPTSDQDRLRAPAFEDRPTGARAQAGARLASDVIVPHAVAYERIVIDDPDARMPEPVTADPAVVFTTLVAGGATGSSPAARSRARSSEAGSVLSASQGVEQFAVTRVDRLAALDDAGHEVGRNAPGAVLSRTDAQARLQTLAADGGRYQLVPEVQVA